MAGKKKIDDWYSIGRDLAAQLKHARYGEQKKIYAEVAKKTGLTQLYLRRLVMAADAIAFIARFDGETATKLQSVSVKASIALERWLSYSVPDAISAARALVDGKLSVNRLEQSEQEERIRAMSSNEGVERPEERTWRFITAATDHLRDQLSERMLSWTSDSVTFLADPMAAMALPASLAMLTAPPFFSQVWTGPNGSRPLAVVILYMDHPSEADCQRLNTQVFALCGLASFGFDSLLITNHTDRATDARRMLRVAGLEHFVKVMHFEIP